jgi:DNA-binding response OmpR family regulator
MGASWAMSGWFTRRHVEVPRAETIDEISDTVEVGNFKLDRSSKKAFVRGIELQLSANEFDLLQFLLSHPKKLVTPRTVLSTAPGRSPIRQTEFLKTLLSLRLKLDEAAPGEHYLRTEPWVLYSFNAAG